METVTHPYDGKLVAHPSPHEHPIPQDRIDAAVDEVLDHGWGEVRIVVKGHRVECLYINRTERVPLKP